MYSRSVEAGDAAVVHVDAVREQDQDQNLIVRPIGSLAECRRALFADTSPIDAEQSSHSQAIKQTLTIQRVEDARCGAGMLLASSIGVAQSRS